MINASKGWIPDSHILSTDRPCPDLEFFCIFDNTMQNDYKCIGCKEILALTEFNIISRDEIEKSRKILLA